MSLPLPFAPQALAPWQERRRVRLAPLPQQRRVQRPAPRQRLAQRVQRWRRRSRCRGCRRRRPSQCRARSRGSRRRCLAARHLRRRLALTCPALCRTWACPRRRPRRPTLTWLPSSCEPGGGRAGDGPSPGWHGAGAGMVGEEGHRVLPCIVPAGPGLPGLPGLPSCPLLPLHPCCVGALLSPLGSHPHCFGTSLALLPSPCAEPRRSRPTLQSRRPPPLARRHPGFEASPDCC